MIIKNYLMLFLTLLTLEVKAVEAISPEEAFKLQTDKKAILIDVREVEEFSKGKIKNASVLPLSEMEKDKVNWSKKVSEFKKVQPLVLYCRSGRRSGIVGLELEKMGYKVYNLGGFDSWKAKGLPTE